MSSFELSHRICESCPVLDDVAGLRAFVLSVDSGSFTGAARVLGLTTNAVSQRVGLLEKHLGVRLLQRTTRRMSVTDEGRRVYARAHDILDELLRVEEDLRPEHDALVGTVRVSMPAPAASAELINALGVELQRHARLRVQLLISHAPVDIVAEGLDVAVHVGEPRDSGLIARKLGDPSWCLAATPSYLDRRGRPRRADDLTKHECLRFLAERPQSEWRLVDSRGREHVVPVGGAFESDDSRVLGEATYAGLGIGIRARGELERAITEGRLERVLPGLEFAGPPIYALFARGRLRLARVARFFELLQGVVRQVL